VVSQENEPSDEQLLLASATDPAAFEAFFRRRSEAVLAYFMRRTADPEVAADLMAETFAAALLGARRFRKRPEPALAWLFTIARNELADHGRRGRVAARARRRLGIERVALDDADLARIESSLDAAAVFPAARRELERLPADQRAAVEAYVIEGRGYREIAQEAGCSEAVVRQRVSRGLRALRTGLERS
jgi:RNA polymerase sigma-70 factor (ECF subfamily)